MATLRSSSRVMVFADMREGSLPLENLGLWSRGQSRPNNPVYALETHSLLICVRTYRNFMYQSRKIQRIDRGEIQNRNLLGPSLTSISGSSASSKPPQLSMVDFEATLSESQVTSACSISASRSSCNPNLHSARATPRRRYSGITP